jgi:hypothetical protein
MQFLHEKPFQQVRYEKMGMGTLFGTRHSRAKDRAHIISALADKFEKVSLGRSRPVTGYDSQDFLRLADRLISDIDQGFYELVCPNAQQLQQIKSDGIQLHCHPLEVVIQCLKEVHRFGDESVRDLRIDLANRLQREQAVIVKTT